MARILQHWREGKADVQPAVPCINHAAVQRKGLFDAVSVLPMTPASGRLRIDEHALIAEFRPAQGLSRSEIRINLRFGPGPGDDARQISATSIPHDAGAVIRRGSGQPGVDEFRFEPAINGWGHVRGLEVAVRERLGRCKNAPHRQDQDHAPAEESFRRKEGCESQGGLLGQKENSIGILCPVINYYFYLIFLICSPVTLISGTFIQE